MSVSGNSQCVWSIASDSIGLVIALAFISLFVWKLWFTDKDTDKVLVFHLDKPVLYLSYLFFLLSASTFALNMVYAIMSCYSADSEDNKFRFDLFLVLLILSESMFKTVFMALMVIQLFHAFRGQPHALDDMTRFTMMLLIGIQFFIEILYDINLSFVTSDNSKWNRMLPAVYLLVDVCIALALILMFLHKLSLSIKEEKVQHLQSAAGATVNGDDDGSDSADFVALRTIKSRRRIVFCCVTAVVARSIYLSVVITEELLNDTEEFAVMYSLRSWITMICIVIQSICVFLLFPFEEERYECLCGPCIKCCGGGKHRRSMEDYQRL